MLNTINSSVPRGDQTHVQCAVTSYGWSHVRSVSSLHPVSLCKYGWKRQERQ